MDVQAAAATTTATAAATVYPTSSPYGVTPPAPSSSPAVSTASPVITPAASAPAVAAPTSSGTSSGSSTGSNSSAIGPHPGLATLPAGPADGSKKGAIDSPLASGVAQLFSAQESNISVSFQISQDPNEIITVFTDKQTGKVIVQFPSETMIALAKFFNKIDDAAVVNKKV